MASHRSLRRALAQRFAAIAIGALVLQLGYIIYDYSRKPGDLFETALERDLDQLAAAIPEGSGRIVVPEDLAARFARYPENYGFEIRGTWGAVVSSANASILDAFAVDVARFGQDIIVADNSDGDRKLMESRSVTVGGVGYTIQAAAINDPAGLKKEVLINEVIDHVTLPAVPLSLILFASLWIVLERSLAPVEATARALKDLDPGSGGIRLNLDGAPSEIGALGNAVNTLLDRLDDTIRAHHEFASNVAHELRTPLALIMLDLERSTDPAARHDLAEVQSMTRLIDQILAMSRLEGLGRADFADVDLAALVRSLAARLAPGALESGVELEVDAPPRLFAKGQPEVIDSAVRNLVENAIRVTRPGASVVIAVGPGPRISVRDHGPGIPAERLRDLFDRYHQGDRRTRGAAGLGLAITKKSIELHGGRIEVFSEVDRGSDFTLIFPDEPLDRTGCLE